MSRATDVPLKSNILRDGVEIPEGEETVIGRHQVDENTERAWGYGARGERPEYVGNVSATVMVDYTDTSSTSQTTEIQGDLFFVNENYHRGEGYESQTTVHSSDADGSHSFPLYNTQEKQEGNAKVENPDYMSVVFVPDSDSFPDDVASSSDVTLNKSQSNLKASTTRRRA